MYKFYVLDDITQEDLNDLVLEKNTLEKRLAHLLESKTIQLFDEVNPKTKKYNYDISSFDSLAILYATHSIISNCVENYKPCEYLKEIEELKRKNTFLMKRENKLQIIEQMFKNGVVDLAKLDKIVKS